MSERERIMRTQFVESSGPGSTAEFTAPYRTFLETFIAEHDVLSIVDLGCGDMEVMGRVDLQGARYLGVDLLGGRIVRNLDYFAHRPEMHFEVQDVLTWTPPPCDLLLCKDVLQHWPTDEVVAWLKRLRGFVFKYALITNCNYGANINTDVGFGAWRPLDLLRGPFTVPHASVAFRWNNKDVVLVDNRNSPRHRTSVVLPTRFLDDDLAQIEADND